MLQAGLITQPVDKQVADQIVFGSVEINRNRWNYGITDLVLQWAESKSSKIWPSQGDCERLLSDIRKYRPRFVVLLHSKVRDAVAECLEVRATKPYGHLGRWLKDIPTDFYGVPFPHGNAIPTQKKVRIYQEVVAAAEGRNQVHEASADHGNPSSSVKGKRKTLTPSPDLLELARRIDQLIEAWLRESGVDTARPKDVMPVLIRNGIFVKNHRDGLPLRKLLRKLDDSGQLSVMKTVRCEQRAKNRVWYFCLTS